MPKQTPRKMAMVQMAAAIHKGHKTDAHEACDSEYKVVLTNTSGRGAISSHIGNVEDAFHFARHIDRE